jgi:subtilisin family serine protease
VIAVSATGDLRQKSYYSNDGLNYIDIAAPGGDFRYQVNAAAGTGGQLSTVPSWYGYNVQDCSVTPCAYYAYFQGTSMAGPHVAGVAALTVSQNPGMAPNKVQQKLAQTADPTPCPTSYLPGTPYAATCEGTKKNNSFYGAGQVNALNAVK